MSTLQRALVASGALAAVAASVRHRRRRRPEQLGEAVGAALAGRRERDTVAVVERLRPLCLDVAVGEPTGELGAFALALLVRRHDADAVETAVEELAGRLSPPLRFKLVGPLPPYSFVDLALPVAA